MYAPHVRLACDRIMKLKKRELVGQFLSAELDGRILPDKNAVICGEWLGACPRQPRQGRRVPLTLQHYSSAPLYALSASLESSYQSVSKRRGE